LTALEEAVPHVRESGWDDEAVYEVGSPYISGARATMLRKALDAKADIIIFIDHDISFKPEDLLRLIETPGEVVAGLYRFKKPEVEYMGVLVTGSDHRPELRADGCMRALRVPAGFLKVTKEAVHRFMKAYPELIFGPLYNASVDLFNHGAIDGILWGEDYAFSNRWRACGGEIWIQPDLDLTHHSDDKAYPGNFSIYMREQPGGDLHGDH
jgi:glycosyltransferase involved in cell wall biosynthesis